jgi:hypothetical protein
MLLLCLVSLIIMIKMRLALTTVLLSLLLSIMPVVLAHHSVVGVFNYQNEFSLKGIITDVEWINPHTYLHLDVYDDTGKVTTWKLESAPTAFMKKGGITKAMLLGDGNPVTVTGIVSRNEDLKRGWIYRITYADGHFYQISAPRKPVASK